MEQLDTLRSAHTELEVKFQSQSKELTIAKSDRRHSPLSMYTKLIHLFAVNLVNKDQLDILATLRESVNEDKVSLEAEKEKLKNQIKELSDKNRMQLEQVNGLLMEKVNLQSEGIGHREKMLQRERDFG